MKRKGSRSDFNEARDREIRSVFFSQEVYSTGDAVVKKIAASPSSRFWVDPDRARDVMSRIEKDPEALDRMNPERKRMYLALYERYSRLRSQDPKMSKIDCVSLAIYSGAPEFFLAPSTIRSIIYR